MLSWSSCDISKMSKLADSCVIWKKRASSYLIILTYDQGHAYLTQHPNRWRGEREKRPRPYSKSSWKIPRCSALSRKLVLRQRRRHFAKVTPPPHFSYSLSRQYYVQCTLTIGCSSNLFPRHSVPLVINAQMWNQSSSFARIGERTKKFGDSWEQSSGSSSFGPPNPLWRKLL